MSSDLTLDPSDPLNLLLHSTPRNVQEDTQESSSDWSQLTNALWDSDADHSALKLSYPDVLDYTQPDSYTMNVDICSFGIEPNMLHLDPTKYQQQQSFADIPYSYFSASSGDMLSNHYPFSFQAALEQAHPDSSSSSSISSRSPSISPASPSLETNRLSVTSIPDHTQTKSQVTATPSLSITLPVSQSARETAEELAQRVRQTAGVMLAVPVSAHLSRHSSANTPTPSTPVRTKLPIPRLPRQNSTRPHEKTLSPGGSSYASTSSAASTPPPPTPPPTLSTTTAAPATIDQTPVQMQINLSPPNIGPTMGQMSSTRPKTSHTTIERRYRTNLNARIQSLRMAVPALRVLEDRSSSEGKKIKRAVKGGVMVKGLPGATGIVTPGEDGTMIDVIDERGYVDGVKVARKCSKANVLGKAVEYIKVLKRRELRLRAEQSGLKALISGLVGGPALLREWEKEWIELFGGEERDELDADELANNEAEDEDSDEDEEDEDGETGRKRKRGKIASSAASNANGAAKKADVKDRKMHQLPVHHHHHPAGENAAASNAPVKRKRGRPRKVPVPVPPVSTASNMDLSSQPLSTGQDVNMMAPAQNDTVPTSSQPQQYLLAAFALFSFFNSPLTQSYSSPSQNNHRHHQRGVVLNHPPLAYAPEIVHGLAGAAEHQAASQASSWGFNEYSQAFQLIVSVLILLSMIMSWLRVGVAPQGTSKSWLSTTRRIRSNRSGTDGRKNLDWLEVGGQIVLKDVSSRSRTSLYTCIQVGRAVSAGNSSPSLEDLCTFSLVLHGSGSFIVNALLRGRSRVVWDRAKVLCASLLRKPGKHVHVYERLVLDNIDVDEAVTRLSSTVVVPVQLGLDMDQVPSPLKVLGAIAVRDRMKKHLAAAFVKTAAAVDNATSDVDEDDEDERQKTFLAASELGGSLAQLGKIAERLCRLVTDGKGRMVTVSSDLVESLASRDEQDEVASLILALVLYQRIFHAHGKDHWTLLSPPPSPGSCSVSADPVFLLKKTLGSHVFDEECIQGLEDARDGAVDLIVDIERKRRH